MSKNILWPLLAFLLLIIGWEWSSRHYQEIVLVLPAPSLVMLRIWEKSDRFLFHSLFTLKTMLGGFFIAFAIAFPLAWLMLLWVSVRRVLQPLFVIIQCVPMFTLAPIMVIWFGWSFAAIVIPTALMIFFPLTINIYQGLRSTPNHLLDYFRINQATPWQTFYKLQLPWALPHILSGMRIAAAIAGIGAIAGEWAGAQSGLGMLMLESRRGADLETSFAALICLTAISLGAYGLITSLENIVCKRSSWQASINKIISLFTLLAVLLLPSCGQNEANGQTRILLDWLPNPNHVPLYVGVGKGFFAKHGIVLEIRKITDPSDSLPYLSSGQAELAVYYMPNTVRAISKGIKIKPIAVMIPEPLNCIIFLKNNGIAKPDDLNKKNIGYCIDGTDKKYLDHLLDFHDITPKAKFNVSFDFVTMLCRKNVDAVYGAYWNIECEQLKSLGFDSDYFKLEDLGMPQYYELVIIAKEGSAQADNAFEKSFQEALQESINFSKDHPEEAFDIYIKANPDKSVKTIKWEKEAWRSTYPLFAKNQSIDESLWRLFVEWDKAVREGG